MTEANETNEANETTKMEYVKCYNDADAPGIEDIDYIVVRVGKPKSGVKHEVAFSVPKTDEEAQKRYSCSMQDIILKGIRGIATAPDFASLWDDEGKIDDPFRVQELANNYTCEKKTKTGKVKQKNDLLNDIASIDLTDPAAIEKMASMVAKAQALKG